MAQAEFPANVRIVLCRPKYEANIGFVCRAMKTMGLSELAIVAAGGAEGDGAAEAGGRTTAGYDEKAVAATAVHAADLYHAAAWYQSLDDAVTDCVLVAGTTRRRGKRRKRAILLPEEFAALAAGVQGPVALAFGNEETGLTSDELAACSVAVTIPTDEAFPSLNLSHPVQVMTYVLYRQGRARPASTPVTAARARRAVTSIVEHLTAMDYVDLAGLIPVQSLLSDIVGRARVTEGELRELERIFRKLRYRYATDNDDES